MSGVMDSVLISIFVYLPEIILILVLGFKLCNLKIEIKKIFLIACIQVCIVFVVKFANLGFGIFNILQIIILWLLVSIITNNKLYKASVPVLLGFVVDAIIQFTIVTVLNVFWEMDIAKLGIIFFPTLISGLNIFLIEILLVLIIKKTNFIFCDLREEEELT